MVKTFDTSRVGGGTYELEQDSSGNYKLKSVGFEQVNKLNLPDLTNLDLPATTTPVKPEEKKDIADPFKKLASQQDGGGDNNNIYQDYDRIKPTEAKVKEATVKDFSDRQRLDPRDDRSPTDIQNLKDAQATYRSTAPNLTSAPGYGTSFSGTGQDLIDRKAANETIMSAREKYATETQYNPTSTTTGLQKVKSTVSNTVNDIMKGSATVAIAKGIGSIIGGISNSLIGPQQVALNTSNKNALSAVGYKTNFELGVSTDPGRIAGNPANNVFAGMNAQSARGNVMTGSANRVKTRETVGIQRVEARYGKNSQKAKDFKAKTETFKNQRQEVLDQQEKQQAARNKATMNQGPPSQSGGGGDPGCFIKGTLITMLDGTKKPVEQVDLGNEVAVGGKVFAVGRFLNTELYDYKGIKVSGSHMVNEDGTWLRVRDTKHGKSLGDDLNTVYVFGSENRRILINDILFTDYFEVSEQDKLIEDSEDFFNNWKDYGNSVDVDNVAILNMNYEI